TTTQSYFPKDNSEYFEGSEKSILDWLRQFSPADESDTFLRGFLGRMLFSGEEVMKKASVLSGGEKVRCMLSKMMLSNSTVLVLDDPTNHLDLESITALNNGLESFKGVLLFSSHDHQLISTIATRIIEVTPNGIVDKEATYDEYLENEALQQQVESLYQNA
ncbi:MAG: ATP-binding cassette domain-containing protein, partial [Exiguobacterium sp.]